MRKRMNGNQFRILTTSIGGPEGGFCDLTKEAVPLSGTERITSDSSQRISVESALLELCREIAGTVLRGLQEGQDPVRLKRGLCRNLQEVGDFSESQAKSLVSLGIELIRAKSAGEYRKDSREISTLVAKALGQENPEGWN